jgi:hypothetical protein
MKPIKVALQMEMLAVVFGVASVMHALEGSGMGALSCAMVLGLLLRWSKTTRSL